MSTAEAAIAAEGGRVTQGVTLKFQVLVEATAGDPLSLQTSVTLLLEPDGQPGAGGVYCNFVTAPTFVGVTVTGASLTQSSIEPVTWAVPSVNSIVMGSFGKYGFPELRSG